MDKAVGSLNIMPDPPSLARHVAEWMTEAALTADGPFRVRVGRVDLCAVGVATCPQTAHGPEEEVGAEGDLVGGLARRQRTEHVR